MMSRKKLLGQLKEMKNKYKNTNMAAILFVFLIIGAFFLLYMVDSDTYSTCRFKNSKKI